MKKVRDFLGLVVAFPLFFWFSFTAFISPNDREKQLAERLEKDVELFGWGMVVGIGGMLLLQPVTPSALVFLLFMAAVLCCVAQRKVAVLLVLAGSLIEGVVGILSELVKPATTK